MINNADYKNIKLTNNVLEFINDNRVDKVKIGLLFNDWCDFKGGQFISYRTFKRVIHELEERELIFTQKITGGARGTTTLISKMEEVKNE